MYRPLTAIASGPSASAQNGTHLLEPLLCPKSVAFIGASNRSGSLGNNMVRTAAMDGYSGRLYAVNPRESEIEGLSCYANLADLPEKVDHAVIALADQRVEQALRNVIENDVKAVTIFTGCDLSDEGDDGLVGRVEAMTREAGIQMCGPNSMGLLNPRIGLRLNGYFSEIPLTPGNIALIVQSGSVFSALAYNHPRLKFSFCASTGRELTTRSEDYMLWALERPETRVIGLFQETSRDPEKFVTALSLAQKRGIPVVVLKVGKSELSAHFAASHSGAITGNAAAYEAAFRSYGVVETATLDEFAACLQLFSQVDAANLPDGHLAGIHDSGGEREMVVDLAEREGVKYAEISEVTRNILRENLDSGLKPENPLDAWGSGHEFETKVQNCMAALMNDPATGALAVFQDMRDASFVAHGFLSALRNAMDGSGKPAMIVSNYAGVAHANIALEAVNSGVPVIEGTLEGLKAIGAVFAYRDRRNRQVYPVVATDPAIIRKWRDRLQQPDDMSEAEALGLLADYGIPVPVTRSIAGPQDLKAAADSVGFPLVLKTAAPGIHHKSDVDGVKLGLADMQSTGDAYDEMSARLGPQAVLERMMPKGHEIAFGIAQDENFGPFVMVAAGGIWIEALNDRVVALPPFDIGEARDMIDNLRMRPMLEGGRGIARVDLEATARALSDFSRLAADLGDLICEMDVNPLFANAEGICAVDALVTTSAGRSSDI